MWRRFFRFRMVPGVMIHPRFGRIDFRLDDLDVGMLRQIVQEGCYYLELTPEGQKEFYVVDVALNDEVVPVSKGAKRRKNAL